jgi:5-methylcytosine-specific restriction endonuclease McrA
MATPNLSVDRGPDFQVCGEIHFRSGTRIALAPTMTRATNAVSGTSSASDTKTKKKKRKLPLGGAPPPESSSAESAKGESEGARAEIFAELKTLCGSRRRQTVRFITLLEKVDAEKLFRVEGYGSMFRFCVDGLRMSEHEAFLLIAGARLYRRFPAIAPLIENGDLHLSGLCLVRNLLTEENFEAMIEAIRRKTKREIQDFVAQVAPKPNNITPSITPITDPTGTARSSVTPWDGQFDLVQLLFRRGAREKLERLVNYTLHLNPTGDLGAALEIAADRLIAHTAKQKFKETSRPQKNPRPKKPGTGPSTATVREVYARDGKQCIYVSSKGVRCTERAYLTLDHIHAHGKGGSDKPANLRVYCMGHNHLHETEDFSKDFIDERIKKNREHLRQRKQLKGGASAAPKKPTRPTPPTSKAIRAAMRAARKPRRQRMPKPTVQSQSPKRGARRARRRG